MYFGHNLEHVQVYSMAQNIRLIFVVEVTIFMYLGGTD